MKHLYTICLLCMLLAFNSCGKKSTPLPVKPNGPDVPEVPVKPAEPDNSDYHTDGEVAKLQFNSDNGVNIVILGDGFIKDDLKKNGVFDTQVKQIADYLFTVAPFKQYKQNFNIYTVYAESAQRGAAKGGYSASAPTRFKSYFYKDIDRLLAAGDVNTCFTYVEKAVPISKANLIILLVNDGTYGGSGGNIAVISSHQLSKYIMVHEIGHTFAGLGDEYVDLPIANNYSVDMVPYLPNIDTTSNPAFLKWGAYYNRPAYKNYIGAFQGAYYRDKGFYRPENRSVMTDLNMLSFNAPSREAIARRINEIINTPFDLQAFLAADATSIKPVTLSLNTPILSLPKHDFINMRQRLMELHKTKVQ